MVDKFSIIYNLYCIGILSSSSSIYLYIGDVVLRVGSLWGSHKNDLFLLFIEWKTHLIHITNTYLAYYLLKGNPLD